MSWRISQESKYDYDHTNNNNINVINKEKYEWNIYDVNWKKKFI